MKVKLKRVHRRWHRMLLTFLISAFCLTVRPSPRARLVLLIFALILIFFFSKNEHPLI